MQISLIIRPRDRMPWMEELREQIAELRAGGHDVWPRLTFESGDAARVAGNAVRAGADLVIAAGGDGTVNEVANGLAEEEWPGPLAIIPLGTANDFAVSLDIPEELPQAIEVALGDVERTVDIARVNDRHFLNVSTGGVGASATDETSQDTKWLLGPLAYLVTGVQKLPELEPLTARFTTPDGVAYEGEIMMYAVGNGQQTGAGSRLTPRAELDDGELDVLIVPGMSRMEFMALAPSLRSGAAVEDEDADVRYFRTPRLTVESDASLAVNADGEPVSGESFEYVITGRTLSVRVP